MSKAKKPTRAQYVTGLMKQYDEQKAAFEKRRSGQEAQAVLKIPSPDKAQKQPALAMPKSSRQANKSAPRHFRHSLGMCLEPCEDSYQLLFRLATRYTNGPELIRLVVNAGRGKRIPIDVEAELNHYGLLLGEVRRIKGRLTEFAVNMCGQLEPSHYGVAVHIAGEVIYFTPPGWDEWYLGHTVDERENLTIDDIFAHLRTLQQPGMTIPNCPDLDK